MSRKPGDEIGKESGLSCESAVLGFDMMLDRAGRVWLVEANELPGFANFDETAGVGELAARFVGDLYSFLAARAEAPAAAEGTAEAVVDGGAFGFEEVHISMDCPRDGGEAS